MSGNGAERVKNLLLRIMLFPDGIYSFKVDNGNTKLMCETNLRLTIKQQNKGR